MKLAIFGATGGTGKQLVEQALATGHQVVAFVRDPSRLTTRHERLTIMQGELADRAAIERAVLGADAVISVLGPRRGARAKSITRGTENILVAMNKHGVRRIVVTSTPSAQDPSDVPDFRFKLAVSMIQLIARGAYEDIVNTAQVVRASDRDWTIVRVSMLVDAPKTGVVKVGHVNKEMGMRITRADLAEFVLKQVQDTTYLRQAPAISN
jgi:nucleoside-diphosphate-sugar epimerase